MSLGLLNWWFGLAAPVPDINSKQMNAIYEVVRSHLRNCEWVSDDHDNTIKYAYHRWFDMGVEVGNMERTHIGSVILRNDPLHRAPAYTLHVRIYEANDLYTDQFLIGESDEVYTNEWIFHQNMMFIGGMFFRDTYKPTKNNSEIVRAIAESMGYNQDVLTPDGWFKFPQPFTIVDDEVGYYCNGVHREGSQEAKKNVDFIVNISPKPMNSSLWRDPHHGGEES